MRRPLLCSLVLFIVASPRPAQPCTQAYVLGAQAPAEGVVYPSDGDLWIAFNGPDQAVTADLLAPDGTARPLPLTRADPDVLRASLPALPAGPRYVVRVRTNPDVVQREVAFVRGDAPTPAVVAPTDWSATFEAREAGPCSGPGLYATVTVREPPRPGVVLWRVVRSDGEAVGALFASEPPRPEPTRAVLRVARAAPTCLRLVAVGANGAQAPSAEQVCFPPTRLDAGVLDAGEPPAPDATVDAGPEGDAGAVDAGHGADASAPDAAPGRPDATSGPDLAAGDDGCGCRSTAPRPAGAGLLGLVLLGGLARRRRPSSPSPRRAPPAAPR